MFFGISGKVKVFFKDGHRNEVNTDAWSQRNGTKIQIFGRLRLFNPLLWHAIEQTILAVQGMLMMMSMIALESSKPLKI